jgi:hypothetical protein
VLDDLAIMDEDDTETFKYMVEKVGLAEVQKRKDFL